MIENTISEVNDKVEVGVVFDKYKTGTSHVLSVCVW